MSDTLENQVNVVELKRINPQFAKEVHPLLSQINTGAELLRLASHNCGSDVPDESSQCVQAWVQLAVFLLNSKRPYEALALFWSLYEHMLQAQTSTRVAKGTPLLWISECYRHLNFPLHAKRHLMLAHCEDALTYKGQVPPEKVGAYFRLAWRHGLSDTELERYANEFYKLSTEERGSSLFPEALLQGIDDGWITELPSPNEAFAYRVSQTYVKHLLGKLGDRSGQMLERLASYLMSCMPGCRTRRRKRSASTDYDVVCAMEGIDVDFRSEFGRHFVCECKDWNVPADFTTMAKFCRVLDSTKSRFGIIFSKLGVSGAGHSRNAEREQLKVFQDRGIVIVVIDESDLSKVAQGANLISMLRELYEKVRLDYQA